MGTWVPLPLSIPWHNLSRCLAAGWNTRVSCLSPGPCCYFSSWEPFLSSFYAISFVIQSPGNCTSSSWLRIPSGCPGTYEGSMFKKLSCSLGGPLFWGWCDEARKECEGNWEEREGLGCGLKSSWMWWGLWCCHLEQGMVVTHILLMQQCRSSCRNYMWKVKSLSQNALLWYWSSIWLFFTFWSNSELRRLLPNSGNCTAGQHLSLLTGLSEKEKTQNFSRGCCVVQLSGSLNSAHLNNSSGSQEQTLLPKSVEPIQSSFTSEKFP